MKTPPATPMTKAGTPDDMAALAGADGAFHRTIAQASRNSLLIEVYDYLGTARDRPHRVVSPGLLTGVGALLPTIQHDKGVSEAWSGVLTTLPLVARASHRFGTAKLLVAALSVLMAGAGTRPGATGW
ncbi:hypothetical protein ABH920_004981 [Catenulispora sp. EB89]|uniref:FCD domain-containing protein n=1 Tax=Catenulispora sp. EB89 TaxID=3156257 RepID=UPI003512AC8A